MYAMNHCALSTAFIEDEVPIIWVTPNIIDSMMLNNICLLDNDLRDSKALWEERPKKRKSPLILRVGSHFEGINDNWKVVERNGED